MAASSGRNFKLYDGTGGGKTLIAAMRQTSFTMNGETVDVTTKDSTNQARELLAGGGITSMSISASGLLTANAQATTMLGRVKARSLDAYTLEFDNGDTITGSFQMTSFGGAGAYNDAQTYEMSLESSGDFTLTPAS